MTATTLAAGALAVASVVTGLVRIGTWLIARRERDATAAIRRASFAARAAAEVCK